MTYYYIDNKLYKILGTDSDHDKFIMINFCELVNHDKNWVIVVTFLVCWETPTF